MKFIKRLPHEATEMKDAIFGWDIFWCRDYGNVDGMFKRGEDGGGYIPNVPGIFGYTIILAVNLWSCRFIKRLFIRIR